MKSKIIHIFKNFKNASLSANNNLTYKPILRSRFVDSSSKAIVYAYAFPDFKRGMILFKPICMETGRGRGVLSKFFLSRMSFKKYSMNGQIIGFKKSRWLLMQLLFLYLGLILRFRSDLKLFLSRLLKFLWSFCLCSIRRVTFLAINSPRLLAPFLFL